MLDTWNSALASSVGCLSRNEAGKYVFRWRKNWHAIREAKVRPIKNQLYSPNTPSYVREQMLAQLGVNFRSPRQQIVNGVCLLDKAN